MDESASANEIQLIVRCQRRDTGAFSDLIGIYHNRLLYYVRRLVENDEVADDVMQEVWLAAWNGLGALKNPLFASVWLYRIARNRSVQHWRRRWREVPLAEEAELAIQPEDPMQAGERAAQIHGGLAALPLPQREVLTLRYLEAMSYEDIALVTNCEVGTVRSRIHYGKKALRKIIEEMENGDRSTTSQATS